MSDAIQESIALQNEALAIIQEEIDKTKERIRVRTEEMATLKAIFKGDKSIEELEKHSKAKKVIDRIRKDHPGISDAEIPTAARGQYQTLLTNNTFDKKRLGKLAIAQDKVRNQPPPTDKKSLEERVEAIKETMASLDLKDEKRLGKLVIAQDKVENEPSPIDKKSFKERTEAIKEIIADLNLKDKFEVAASTKNSIMGDSFVASGLTLKDSNRIVEDFGNNSPSQALANAPFGNAPDSRPVVVIRTQTPKHDLWGQSFFIKGKRAVLIVARHNQPPANSVVLKIDRIQGEFADHNRIFRRQPLRITFEEFCGLGRRNSRSAAQNGW